MDVLVGFVSSQVVSNIALTLIHFVWQGALIAALLWIGLLCIPRNNFKLRYRCAVLALILCTISPIATFTYIDQNPSVVKDYLAQDGLAESGVADFKRNSNSDLGPLLASETNNVSGSEGLFNSTNYLGYILFAWILGCVVMTSKFVIDLNRTFKLTREGVAKVSYRVENIVNNLSSKYKLNRRITILKSRKVNVPVVIGWLKPVILLPIAITIGLETKHLELIIAHELAHIKRMDFAVNLFQSIVQICLFYHPVVYWINKVIRDEREYICDQLALRVLGNDESAKINLAKALLGTEELREGNLSLVAVAASGGMLKHRISHILDSQYKPATSLKGLLIGTMVFLFSFAALSTTFELNDNSVVTTASFKLPDKVEAKPVIRIGLEDNLETFKKHRQELNRSNKTISRSNKEVSIRSSVSETPKSSKETAPLLSSSAIVNPTESDSIQSETNSDEVSSKKRSLNSSLLPSERKNRIFSNKSQLDNNVDSQLVKTSSTTKDIASSSQLTKVNNALYRELSSKALTDQYLLPAEVLANESRLLKTAALDLQSVSSFREPKAIFTPYPKYPRRAWDKMINQTVRVNFNITRAGVVSDISIIEEADKDFSREIRRKLSSWKYKPAVKNGIKVTYSTSMEFVFKAPQKDPIMPITTGSRIRRR